MSKNRQTRLPDPDALAHLASINPEGSRRHCHPLKVDGRFARVHPWIYWTFFGLWLVMPWMTVNGRPLMQFDIMARRFYLFGESFNAQDAWLGFFFLSGVAFLLFVFSALWGRIWCGFACPHTVILESLYRPIEVFFEGKPGARRRRDAKPFSGWTADDWLRKLGKWSVYLVISLIVAHMFVAYFVSLPGLLQMVRHSPGDNLTAFLWMAGVTGLVFFNFTWFREQLCLAICPYGRLQSILADEDTVVVGYDLARGEPRGKSRDQVKVQGDCIDCRKCVAVCPTGIDIRNGMQIECIGCSACIDACAIVMGKQGKPPGLVRYDSTSGFQGKARRFWRPRVFFYLIAGFAGLVAFGVGWRHSEPFNANILRLSGTPYTVTDGVIQNAFELHIENKRASPVELTIGGDLPDGFTLVTPMQKLKLEGRSGARVPLFFRIDADRFTGDMSVDLVLFDGSDDHPITARFLGPDQ